MKKVKKSLTLIANKLSERDINALKSIYDLRCLTAHQLYQLHYSLNQKTNTIVSDTYCKRKIRQFLDLGIIEEHTYNPDKHCYFLTSVGVDLVRASFNLPNNILDSKRKVVSRGYLRPSELKINSKLIPHQLHLNQFFIDLHNSNINCSYKYEDAKHSSFFRNIAPDAFLIANDIQFFIEMDLGTESKKLLTDKWKHYRNFLNSEEFHFTERKIIVLFIVDNVTDIEKRTNLIKLTAHEELIDLINENFEIYAGDRNTILNLLQTKLLVKDLDTSNSTLANISDIFSNYHNIQSKPAYILSEHLENANSFMYFSRTSKDNGSKYFLITEHTFSPISTFSKIAYFERTQNLFYNIFEQRVYLLVIVDSPMDILNDLLFINTFNPNTYFTTKERLDTLEFEKAIFQIDISGNLFTFDATISNRIFQENLLSK